MDIIVVDGDPARRAQIRAMIECAGGTCAVFETEAQFDSRPVRSLIAFVADEMRMVRSLAILFARFDIPPHLIAYRPAPAAHDVVGALKAGADDYLDWPFGPRDIRMRLQAARRRHAGAMDGVAQPGIIATTPSPALVTERLVRGLRLAWSRDAMRAGRR